MMVSRPPPTPAFLLSAMLAVVGLPALAEDPDTYHRTSPSCVHEMRYESVAGLIVVSLSIADSPPFDFVLDSGATQSSLTDPLLAAALDLRVRKSGLARGVGSAATWVLVTERAGIRNDGFQILRVPLVIHDIGPRLEATAGREIHGFLGADLFERYVVEIDPGERRVLLYEPATFRFQGAAHHIPLEVIDRRPVVQGTAVVKEHGAAVAVRLVVDTGSSRSLSLITKSARHLKPPSDRAEGASVGVVGESRVFLASTERLQIGPVVAEGVETAWVGTLGMPAIGKIPNLNGILGNRFLSRFRVFIDYHRGRLILSDPRAPSGAAHGFPG